MSLDLGALVGEVRLDATLFETTYVRVVRQMAELGAKAGAASVGTSNLDRSLAQAGASANAAAAGLGRADEALAGAGVSASEAAAATSALQTAQLRLVAAQERLAVVQANGTATAGKLAAAHASVLSATDRVVAAQSRLVTTGEAAVRSTLVEADAAMKAAAAESGRAAAATEASAALLRELSASERQAVAVAQSAAATTDAALAQSRYTQATIRAQIAQDRLTALQASGTASTRELAAAQAALIAANDRVALSNDRLTKSTGLTSDAWQSAGRGMVVAGGLISAAFVMAGKAAVDFDGKMALVQTLAKASPAEMAQLRTAALSVGQAYGYSAGQVADAEAELVKAGLSVKDITGGALVGALTLAAAGQEDVAAATNTAAVAMTQFGLSGKDVPHIADLLAAGADKALGSVADLSEALTYGGVAAHQAGISIETTVGVLAELAQSGQLGSIAGTQFAQMLRNLEAPTSKAQAEMKALGLEVYGANGQMLPMAQIAQELHDKIGALPPVQQNAALAALFTARSVRAATILMRDGAQGVDDWTRKVDDSGFAALQASGKLNSFSGDLTKLKSALNAAFIGVGENAQGPLRSIVQDVTQVVEAWSKLPGPVKTGAEALSGVASAVLLVGGGMLLLLPRIQKTREAMEELGVSGSRVGGILGKGGLLLASITAATMAVSAIDDAMGHTSLNADAMSASLEHLARTGQASGELTRAFGADLSGLKTAVSLSSQGIDVFGLKFHSLSQTLTHSGGDFADARNKITSVDQALATMVTSGHADDARTAYDELTAAAKAQGVSVQTLAARFPQYAGAVRASAASAANAANGVDQYGNAVGAAAAKTKSATDAANDYNDALHALADPLFAMNKAVVDLTDKQSTATATIKKYGAASSQAKQAQIDVASSALDVAAAAKTLTGSVNDGTTSLSGAKSMLHQWVAAGIITKSEAAAVARSFGGIIDKAGNIAGALGKASGAAAAAAGQFRTAGADAAQGYADGITSREVQAIRAAEHMGLLSAQAAKNAIQSSSPSKVFKAIGASAPEGYAIGVESGTAKVTSAAQKLAAASRKAVIPPMATLGADLAKALGSGFGGYSGQLAKIFTGSTLSALDAVANRLHTAVEKYQTDVASSTQMKSSISQGLLGAADISNLALSNTGGGAIRSNNATILAQLTRESKDVTRLQKLHLDPTYLQQIASASPQQGVALAEDILSGHEGSIAGLNRQQRQLQALANRVGGTVANATFATTLQHDQAVLDKVAHALVTFVNKKLDLSASAERAMERAFEQALRKAAPTLNLTDLDHALGLAVHHAS